jgi:transcriptional regulator with XRE-family HTH domain
MTQAALAEKLGISDRAVSKWETARSLPDAGIMLELCEILNINVNELLSGERSLKQSNNRLPPKKGIAKLTTQRWPIYSMANH